MTGRPLIGPLLDTDLLAEVDLRVADLLSRRCAVDDLLVLDLVVLLVAAQRSGHACLDLRLVGELRQSLLAGSGVDDESPVPAAADLAAALLASPAVSNAGEPSQDGLVRPLVLDGLRLHSQRSWTDEESVSDRLRRLAAWRTATVVDLDKRLGRLFSDQGIDDPQRRAARSFVENGLTVFVGGPGTGKTYTIARALAAALEPDHDGRIPRIAVCAPTGKAAARAGDSLAEAAEVLGGDVADRLLAITPSTIHRLLGNRPNVRTRFRHDPDRLLDIDAVVVDETSMVSQALLSRLVEALPLGCRLLLAGDPSQLESIEAGSVLRDVVDAAKVDGSPLHDRVVELTTNWRVADRSPVIDLAEAIRENRPDDVVGLLRSVGDAVRWIETDHPTDRAEEVLTEMVRPLAETSWVIESADDEAGLLDCLKAAVAHRLLCGHRHGPTGVSTWNRLVAEQLGGRGAWYPGRPLLVTRSEIRTGLVNGDTGIVVGTPLGPRACFRIHGRPTLLSQAQLPPTETAYALTVHKSQGSEYPAVTLLLPPVGSPLLKRELLYTAVTRASGSVTVVGSEAALRTAVSERAVRMTGLVDALAAP